MKIDFSKPIKNLQGIPYLITELNGNGQIVPVLDENGNQKIQTLGYICAIALDQITEEDTNSKKYEKGKLAYEIIKGGEIEITSEQIVMIKDLLEKIYIPTVISQVFDYLELKE